MPVVGFPNFGANDRNEFVTIANRQQLIGRLTGWTQMPRFGLDIRGVVGMIQSGEDGVKFEGAVKFPLLEIAIRRVVELKEKSVIGRELVVVLVETQLFLGAHNHPIE